MSSEKTHKKSPQALAQRILPTRILHYFVRFSVFGEFSNVAEG